MDRQRLDQAMVELGLVPSRSQAESYIKLGKVKIFGKVATKPGQLVSFKDKSSIKLDVEHQYVGRAGLKLESVATDFKLNFKDKTVLDVGSSTGGFTEFSLSRGAKKVICVEVGSYQMHPSLRDNPKIELHEKMDIRDFKTDQRIDLVLIDVSFISLRHILPSVSSLVPRSAEIVAMVKPQFEAKQSELKHKGIIKNDKMRRDIFKDFETWTHDKFIIRAKLDSGVAGAKGNRERFYILQKI
jgi:23S rRNA (cytidine1920-2'-O)/16S rRNA (cytidine1409-2'-O)-methyltransferase